MTANGAAGRPRGLIDPDDRNFTNSTCGGSMRVLSERGYLCAVTWAVCEGVIVTSASMTGPAEAQRILAHTKSVLVIDWPSREVPATLADAGFTVTVKGGPGPADFTTWEIANGEPVTRPLGHAPEHADLVYCHRPFSELESIISVAQGLGAAAIWWQTGLTSTGAKAPDGCWVPPRESRQGRDLADAAGLHYVDDVYIVDAIRALRQSS